MRHVTCMRVTVPKDAVDGVSGAARPRLHTDDFVAQQLNEDGIRTQLIKKFFLTFKARY